jgi:WD40 repeat protein/Tfp pilus assembly protein PilF
MHHAVEQCRIYRGAYAPHMAEDRAADHVVGRYRILRVLGQGGVGVTYEAEPLGGGPHVAIKELRLSRVEDWKVIELFEREARVLADVTHPAVPAYVDHFSLEDASGPVFYLVQELAPGRSLADLVASGWRADEGEAKRIAAVLLDVLEYLHARRPPVYHRDIKPQNVLRGEGGKVWLVDFGAVRDVYRSTTVGGSTVAGTFGYMAPEQLRGVARPESDLHGLGATLVHVLSGRSPAEMPQRKLRTEFRPHVRISAEFAVWLETMLEPAPEDRFPSAHRALVALQNPRLTSAVSTGRSRTVALGAALALVLMAGAAVGLSELRGRVVKLAPGQTAASTPRLPQRPGDWRFPAVSYVRSIPAHMSAVSDAAFTPNGAQLLTASFDGTVKIWDARTGQSIRALPGHTMRVGAVRVTADGRRAVTAGDHTLRIWSLPDGRPLKTIDADSNQVFCAAASPTGETIASGGSDGQARVWTLGGSPVATLAHGGTRVLSVEFSPDGSRLATAGDDKTIKVWDVADWKLLRTFAGHTAGINKALIAPDGQVLASASDDHTVRLWHMGSGAALATLSLHADEVWALAFSPDGGTLVSGGKDAIFGVWALPNSTLKQRVELNASTMTLGLAFAPNGVNFAATYGNGVVDLWRLTRGELRSPLPVPNVVSNELPPTTTPEQRGYAEAMDMVDAYGGDRKLLDGAEARLQDVLKGIPRSALALAGLGRVAFRRGYLGGDRYASGDLAKALELSSKAIAIDPALPDAYCVRGWAARASKDSESARAAADTALKLAPTMPRALLLSAELATDRGDLDGAEKAMRVMLSRPIDRHYASNGFAKLAEVFEKSGEVDGAEQAHQREIELQPELAWAKGNYATFLIHKGDYEGAIAMSRQALAQMKYGAAERTLADAYCLKGEQLLWDRGDGNAAGRAFQDAAEADPSEGRAAYDLGAYHQYLAVTQRDSRQMDEAKRWYAKAVGLDPKDELSKRALAALGG